MGRIALESAKFGNASGLMGENLPNYLKSSESRHFMCDRGWIGRVCLAVALVGAGVGLVAGQAAAEGPKPFADFSAKRVKPPKPGETRRINIQIEPGTPNGAQSGDAGADAETVDGAAPTAQVSAAAWFWDSVSPDLSATGPGRLEPALQRVNNPPTGGGVAAPRLADMQRIVQAHGIDILRATIGTKVSPALVLAVIATESGGQVDAVSGAGAQGLMQLMPNTAKRFGVTDSFDASDNIAGGARFLDFLMQRFESDPILVLAGYNAGENSIGQHAGVPPYAETRHYVPKVLAAFHVARALCQTPPQLVSDGCVFAQP